MQPPAELQPGSGRSHGAQLPPRYVKHSLGLNVGTCVETLRWCVVAYIARSCPPDSLMRRTHTRRAVHGPRDRCHKTLRVRNFVPRIGQMLVCVVLLFSMPGMLRLGACALGVIAVAECVQCHLCRTYPLYAQILLRFSLLLARLLKL